MNENSSDEMNVQVVKRITFQEPDWKELTASVNPTIFKTFTGHPMSFHFRIDNPTLKKKFESIVVSFGGRKIESYLEMDTKSALMVLDNTTQYLFDRPSFKVSYIVDCIKKNVLLDISDYLHNTFTFKLINYMNIVFWENGAFKSKVVEQSRDSSESSEEEKKICKHTRDFYSRDEKEAILRFLLSKKKMTGFRGDSIWKKMEKRGVCPKRTYQSMKNHFLKTLLFELDKFEFISQKDKRMLKNT